MIPKTLQLQWIFDDLPPYADYVVKAWTDALPGWTVNLVRGLPDDTPSAIVDLLVDERIPSPFRGDLFRYWYLYEHGGVYVDFDTLPGKPLDPILSEEIVLLRTGFYGSSTYFVDNSLMASAPRHQFWRETLAKAFDPRSWTMPTFWFCGANCYPDIRRHAVTIWENGAEEVPKERAERFIYAPHLDVPSRSHYFTHYRTSGLLGIKGISTQDNPTWLDVFGEYPDHMPIEEILGE